MKVCSNGPGYMTTMASTRIFVKPLYKSSSQNQKADHHGTWYVALGMWGLLSLFKLWSKVDICLLIVKVKFASLCI